MRRRVTTMTLIVLIATACTTAPPTKPKDCTARHPYVDLSGCDLRGGLGTADLHGAILDRADLRGVDLNDAQIDGASLRGADLSNATLVGNEFGDFDSELAYLDLAGANLDGMQLEHGYIRYSNFAGASMRGIDLIYAGIVGGNFVGADLSGTLLVWSSLHGNLRDVVLTGSNLMDATLGGDLRGVDLSDAEFSLMYLDRLDLTGASLRGVMVDQSHFTRLNLTDADLTGLTVSTAFGPSTFSNLTWSNTVCPDAVVRSVPCI